jgi:predicted membrane GTPase involved in stress response
MQSGECVQCLALSATVMIVPSPHTAVSQDELVEVTPKSVRLRKELLDSGARERAARAKAKQLRSAKCS